MVVFKRVRIEKSWDDIKPNFGRFNNLHLELLEAEQKLKPNLPPIPLSTYKGSAMKSPAQFVGGGYGGGGRDRDSGSASERGSDDRDRDRGRDDRSGGKNNVMTPQQNTPHQRTPQQTPQQYQPGRQGGQGGRSDTPFQERQPGDYRGAPSTTTPYQPSQPPHGGGDPVLEALGVEQPRDVNTRDVNTRQPPLPQQGQQGQPQYNSQPNQSQQGQYNQQGQQGQQPGQGQGQPSGDQGAQPQANQESDEDKEKRLKEEHGDLLYKLKFLRKSHPEVDVPPYSEHSDLETLRTIYKDAMREVNRDANFSTYKGWLVGGFLLIEFMSTQLFSIDMTGYAETQNAMMTKYETLLLELGERPYASFGSSLPIEIRLIGLILFNTAIFYIGKLIADKGGDNVVILFESLFGQKVKKPAKASERGNKASERGEGGREGGREGGKKKRKGPSMTPDEIRDLKD